MIEPNEEKLSQLAQWIHETCAEEKDCDEILDRVAAYLEQRGGTNLSQELQSVEQHLRVCPECEEEFQALLRTMDET